MSLRSLMSVVKVGLAFWLLLSPGENWTWVIVGGHEVQQACEEARTERLDGEYLVCAATPPRAAVQPAVADKPAGPGPADGPSPGLARGTNSGR